MKKHNPNLIIYFILFCFIVISCIKDPDEIGLNLLEHQQLDVEFDTTVQIISYSKREDSVRTDEISLNLLGSYFDPVFGKNTASIYTQLRLSVNSPDFEEDPILDSIVLTLAYYGYYGDTTTPQTIKVYEIIESLYIDSTYYSNQSIPNNGIEIASYNFTPTPSDSVMVDTVKYAPHLRINLDPEFGNKILNASEDELSNNENFIEFIKGIYITAEPVNTTGEGAVLYFNLISSLSEVVIYYNDSAEYQLVINENSARFNNYEHYNYEDATIEFKNQVINEDTTLGKDKIYLQAMGGVKAKIKFPEILDLVSTGDIVINDAKLIIPVIETENEYDPPSDLVLLKINEEGKYEFLIDQFEGGDYFGGSYNSSKKEYLFRISRYVQDLLKGNPDYGLNLSISGSSVKANSLVLYGTNSNISMKLKIIYTKID
ncbi:MAG: DUF4270 domain-containing protein [Bacteroidales bacterium]|nr:DUF4270 domain-containing protein [Bacteroidales bacterium]